MKKKVNSMPKKKDFLAFQKVFFVRYIFNECVVEVFLACIIDSYKSLSIFYSYTNYFLISYP